MELESLPVVTFGKYKGQPVTTLLADTKYLEWCKQQDFFKQHKTVYNICVNQTIQSNQPSKTPEHNKLQNLFLKREFLLDFVNKVFYLDESFSLLEKIYCTEEYKEYFGEERFSMEEFGLKKLTFNPIFETDFNWDVKLLCGQHENRTCGRNNNDNRIKLNPKYTVFQVEHLFVKLDRLMGWMSGENPVFSFAQVLSTLYIEIKPLLGDDYPNVLRKMTTQKKLTNDKDGIYILLINEYSSSTTTKEQLVMIFKQSNIMVVFVGDISNGLQCKPVEENFLLEKIKQLEEKNRLLEEKVKQLELL